MWYSYKSEASVPIDYSYLDLLFDNQEEANEFLKIFIKELELAKTNFCLAITRRNTQLFRQTYHNVRPHLEILKINNLSTLLQEVKVKMIDTRQLYDDKELFQCAIANTFDMVIKQINEKLLQNG